MALSEQTQGTQLQTTSATAFTEHSLDKQAKTFEMLLFWAILNTHKLRNFKNQKHIYGKSVLHALLVLTILADYA
jgi:hypothetical protein